MRKTYDEAVDYIFQIPKFTSKNTLADTKIFLQRLGNPENELKIIHIAGTNGKGSVCAYLDTMLQAQGKTVGRFTSPHLLRINERMVMNGQEITDEAFLEVFHQVFTQVQLLEQQGVPHPTFFEFIFGMALLAFVQAGVEYAVLETGLGGRLDATNAVAEKLITGITAIGMDHMEQLGSTIGKIAAEKAGIIRPKVPLFYTDTEAESNQVIEARAKLEQCLCVKIGKNDVQILETGDNYIAFSYRNAYDGTSRWRLSNPAPYQAFNAALGIAMMTHLFGDEGDVPAWKEALAKVVWAGRMEEVLPDIYLDGAHNETAIESFTASVPRDGRENVVLFGAVSDKDYPKMIQILCERMDVTEYVVTHLPNERGVETAELARIFRRHTTRQVTEKEDIKEAAAYIKEQQRGRRIYCIGSLYLVGVLKAYLHPSTASPN